MTLGDFSTFEHDTATIREWVALRWVNTTHLADELRRWLAFFDEESASE